MTTLYKPVKITTAEHAEALPEGTVATSVALGESAVLVQFQGGLFWRRGALQMEDSDLVDWTALVPIEAEEETDAGLDLTPLRRLATPWEEA